MMHAIKTMVLTWGPSLSSGAHDGGEIRFQMSCLLPNFLNTYRRRGLADTRKDALHVIGDCPMHQEVSARAR